METINNKDLSTYKQAIRKTISKYSLQEQGRGLYGDSFSYVSQEKLYNTILEEITNKNQEKKDYEIDGMVGKKLASLLDNAFKKEILLIWLSKFHHLYDFHETEENANSNENISISLKNLTLIGINNQFLISDELNKKIEEEILPNIIKKSKEEFKFIDNIYDLEAIYFKSKLIIFIEAGIYLNNNVTESTDFKHGGMFLKKNMDNYLMKNSVKTTYIANKKNKL